METAIQFKELLSNILKTDILGLSFIEIFFLFLALLLSLILRGAFANLVVNRIKIIVKKTSNKIDDQLFDALASPLKLLPIILVFIFISLYIQIDTQLGIYFDKINRTLTTIFVFWFIHQSLHPLAKVFNKLEQLLSRALVIWLTRSLKYLIIFLGVVAVLEIWGIKIGPVIAGLGLFGVAVALGAQDLFKNLISGILILMERRFHIGDIIEIPGKAIGTVEHIGFRSTLIEQFDTTLISVPNYIFSEAVILNYSQRKYRRIKWIIGLTYDSSVDQLKQICHEIIKYIETSSNYIVSEKYKLYVKVESFSESSIDILVYAFSNTNDWDEFLEIKQELAFKIKTIVEGNNCSFAFPSTSIYLEKK